MNDHSPAKVLAEIAETASETLELQEVFSRVAASIRKLIPVDEVCVIRVLEGKWAVLHATTGECKDSMEASRCSEPYPLSNWSARLRPSPSPMARIDDARIELDPAYPGDAAVIEAGVRSGLWQPFRAGEPFTGGVWLSSYRPNAFTSEHEEILRPIAALIGSAVEHWRIWDAEQRRHLRLDRLESALGPLAESLDVRAVFGRISEALQPVLPHHLLVLTELDGAAPSFRVTATAGEADIAPPTDPIPLTPEEHGRRIREHDLQDDLQATLAPVTARNRLMLSTGMRSWLRVPLWMSGEVRGSIGFCHREPARYGIEDVEIAQRTADRVAVVLSHHRLAEEARVAAEARERAERLEATLETLTRELQAQGRAAVGVSVPWKEVLLQAGRVAASETTVLITGESGTGKEVVSRLIHEGSSRARRPFVAINCAALPEQLLESELFGYEKGAFTGAHAAKIGRVEQAAGGTLFLDEIGEMSPLLQVKFLRLLQEREFQRLGGTRTLRADVRIVAATNRDLELAIEREIFREDLYYRLNVFHIHVPPLRQRPEDILPLAESFVEDLGRTMGRPAAGISRDARDWLLAHPWPGNVRELRNAIERAILLCDGGLITREHLPLVPARQEARSRNGNGSASREPSIPVDGVDLEAVDRGYVESALQQTKGNKSRAARLLGLTRAQLYTRMEKYGLR